MTPSDSDLFGRAGKAVAPRYGKEHACFVASGMAAVELALEFLGIGPDHNVLIPDNVCHSVATAIVRIGARPNFVPVNDWLLPSVEAIRDCIDDSTGAVIAVHQYGLPFPMQDLKAAIPPHIPIIEDCAQAFGAVSQGDPLGVHSDLVATSFGPTKPLSLGGGGALFGNDALISRLMARDRNAERSVLMPRPYPLPAPLLRSLDEAIAGAEAKLLERRVLVDRASAYLRDHGFRLWSARPGDLPSWSRIPIRPHSEKQTKLLESCAEARDLLQRPHARRTSELPQFAAYASTSQEDNEPPPYLVFPERLEAFLNVVEKAGP